MVEDGKVVPGTVMNVNASFDHRFIDGIHAAKMAKALRAHLETDDGLEALGLR